MKIWKKTYTTETLLLDDSFVRWIKEGKPLDDKWGYLLDNDIKVREYAAEAEAVIKALSQTAPSSSSDRERVISLKSRIDARVDMLTPRQQFGQYSKKQDNKRKLWFAASVALLIVSGLLLYGQFNEKTDVLADGKLFNQEIKSTKKGQKLTVHLGDGSVVKLNSQSNIRYKKYFDSEDVRDVYLEGEAFFEVARDKTKPFRVHTSTSVTEALGTSFNIDSRKSEYSNVTLVTGKVLVSGVKVGDEVTLIPGQEVSVTENSISNIRQSEYDNYAWKDDILIFKNANGIDVFLKLNRWYGVEFKNNIPEAYLKEWNYSGKFDNQSLVSVLRSISYTENFEFEIANDTVIIKKQPN